jgi:hypothetical protein
MCRRVRKDASTSAQYSTLDYLCKSQSLMCNSTLFCMSSVFDAVAISTHSKTFKLYSYINCMCQQSLKKHVTNQPSGAITFILVHNAIE